jgi:isopentenyl-diphosphate delta-isomerase
MSKVTPTSARKDDHIRINLEQDVQSGLSSGLERYHFIHNALPEIDIEKIDLSTTFLGKRLSCPILISSMTGGHEKAGAINTSLAEAAQEKGLAMGLGSQRAALEDPSTAWTFQVRQVAPDILLFANLGAVQLNYGLTVDHCQKAVDMIEADALILHLNPLQEALQPEGDTNFSGLLDKIEHVCRKLPVPIVAKEVGWGIAPAVAKKLISAGVTAIDVAGAGGTSWSQVEMHRTQDETHARLASAFVRWGIPTAEVVFSVREALPDIPLIASGGLGGGIDAAKSIALGADLTGMASPFLQPAVQSTQHVIQSIERIMKELRTCMFATGSANITDLRHAGLRVIQ